MNRFVTMVRFDESEPPHVVIDSCEYCGGEIYEGDEVARIDDGEGFVHLDRCSEKYAFERIYDRVGVINADQTIN